MNPIGVKVPDYKYLFESWLTAYGYTSSRFLSEKLTFLLDVAKNQVNEHYSKLFHKQKNQKK